MRERGVTRMGGDSPAARQGPGSGRLRLAPPACSDTPNLRIASGNSGDVRQNVAKAPWPEYHAAMKGRQADGSSDRRWIILAADGRYATLGRATDPSQSEIEDAEAGLTAAGLRGFLAVLSGSAYAPEPPEILLVRPLSGATAEGFAAACEAFRRRTRDAALTDSFHGSGPPAEPD